MLYNYKHYKRDYKSAAFVELRHQNDVSDSE